MSIFKSTFSKHVKDQLKVRQDAINNRTPQNLSYMNSRNAWIRMSSSVNISSDTNPDGDNELAKKYILQGGTLNYNNNINDATLKSGLGDFSKAYSNKSNSGVAYQRGIRPMPGITSMDIKSKSAYGSLREVTIHFQCWDIQQLEDIELLYMRTGYTVLVEWGWTPYLDNNGKYQPNFADYYDIINKKETKREEIFKDLYNKSVKYGGNYDAMFGYIKNYQWSARMDGGYDCTANIISTGELIESLKVNYSLPYTINKDNGVLNNEFSGIGTKSELWISEYEKNSLAGIWAETYWKLRGVKNNEITLANTSSFTNKYTVIDLPYALNTTNSNSKLSEKEKIQVYITLEAMCDVLNKYNSPKSEKDSEGKGLIELSVYSNKYDGADILPLYCIAHPLQLSVDPSVCLIKSPLWYKEGTSSIITPAQSIAAEDPNVKKAKEAAKLIIDGAKGAGTNAPMIQSGVGKIENLSIYLEVERLIAEEKTWSNLQELFNGEYEKENSLQVKLIKETLERNIPKLTVTYGFNGYLIEKSIKIINNNSATVSAGDIATIATKGKQALASLTFLDQLNQFFWEDEKGFDELGIIKEIYVNVDFLYQQALSSHLESKDNKEKNEINLYNYLKSIITNIQSSIGNVNNFEIHVDPVDSKARIIDVNYTELSKDKSSIYNNLFTLQVHNLNSVVRSYSLQSQIFPDQSNLIAIGSQAKGGQMGIQSNTMIDFNKNIIDRIIPKKVIPVKNNELTLDTKTFQTTITQTLAAIINELSAFSTSPLSSTDSPTTDYGSLVSTSKNALRDIIVYFQSITKSPGSNRNLIPTKFSFEMDGIGGLVIGHMFKLPSNIMPRGYRGGKDGIGSQLGNAITSIGHTISNGDWVTKVDTLNIVLEDTAGKDFKDVKLSIADIIQTIKTSISDPTGGETKLINGVARKNGDIDDLLVPMRSDLYNRHWSPECKSDDRRIRLQAAAMQNLEKMLTDAYTAGVYIKVNSAYRTYDDQVRIKNLASGIPCAEPGTSNHGFGLAVDLADKDGTRINITGFSGNKVVKKTLEEWNWIQANKSKYGFENINTTTESHHYNYIK
jgi:hypothetical protein